MNKEASTSKEYSPRPIRPDDTSYGDVLMQFSSHPVKPKYWFEDFGDYWSCSCGQINRSDTCSNCGLERELLRRLFQNEQIGMTQSKAGETDGSVHGDAGDSGADDTGEAGNSGASETGEAAHNGAGDVAKSEAGGAGEAANNGTGDTNGAAKSEAGETNGAAKSEAGETNGATNIRSGGRDASAVVGAGGEYPDEDYDERDSEDYKIRKLRTRRILIVLMFLIFLLGGGLAAFYYYGLPEMSRQEEMEVNAAKDSLARELPGTVEPLKNTDFDIERNLGDHYYDKKEYEKAIEHYTNALKVKDDESIRHKINAAKFSYVSAHQEDGGALFEDYLEDLRKAKYSGIQDIYERHYTWKASIVTNTGADDYSTDMSSINRIHPIYFHTTFSGGPPDESLDLYYEITWPDGTSERRAVSGNKESGETLTTTCRYTFPATPNEGRLTYKLYNNSNHKQIASDSVSLL